MTLVQSWIDSLQLLKPKNLKLFILVTIKSILEAYKLIFKYFWWLLPAFIVITVSLSLIGPFVFSNYYGPLEAIRDYNSYWFYAHMQELSYVLYILLFLAVCLLTRPSIVQKDCSYLRIQYKKIILYSIIISVFSMSSLSAWDIFVILFFLDSEGGPKNFFLSIWYALKMIIFNYPLLAVVGIVMHLPVWLFNLIYLYMYGGIFVFSNLMCNMLGILFLPIGICTYANIYIKRLYDQFDLYNKQLQ